jgi:hypothetical protein
LGFFHGFSGFSANLWLAPFLGCFPGSLLMCVRVHACVCVVDLRLDYLSWFWSRVLYTTS